MPQSCGSTTSSWAYSAPTTRGLDQREWSVFECSGCSHQYMNPQPSWEELQFYYNNSYDPYDPVHGSQNEDDRMIELAKRTGVFRHIPVPMGKRLLDVGCGAGWFLRISKKLGASSKAWSRANTPPDSHGNRACVYFTGRWSHTFEQAPGATQFDIITANHVVEHVPEPVETLRAIKRLLAPGGFAWIAVPNASYPICGALKGLWHITDLPYHLMQFTPLSMAEAGRGNDFDITVVLLPVDFSSLCCAKNA